MSASTQCPHTDFYFNVAVARIENDTLKMADITGRCTVCGKAAVFRCKAPIGMNWDFPTTSPDAQELRLPFSVDGDPVDEARPRPGFSITVR